MSMTKMTFLYLKKYIFMKIHGNYRFDEQSEEKDKQSEEEDEQLEELLMCSV